MPNDDRPDDKPDILITSLVGYKTGGPIVQLEWGEKKGQLSSTEARAHALRILECADAAESDLFIWTYMTEVVGLKVEQAAQVMNDFRKFRLRHDPEILPLRAEPR